MLEKSSTVFICHILTQEFEYLNISSILITNSTESNPF
jgi:hypothetical protein